MKKNEDNKYNESEEIIKKKIEKVEKLAPIEKDNDYEKLYQRAQ